MQPVPAGRQPVPEMQPAPQAPPPLTEVDDGIALVVATSGSTDAPKRVLLSADALRAAADATARALDGPGQWLLALPAHYIAGAQVLVRSILADTEPEVIDREHFEPAAFAEASVRLDPRGPRYTSLVPVQLSRLVEAARADTGIAEALRSFDRILLGGQAAPAALVLAADSLGARVTRTYGSSETAGGCVYDGRPLDGVGVRIVEGRVEVSGPMLADGYLDDPGRTADAFATEPDGTRWYRTGDLGDLAHDGTLRISGRSDDVIVSGGVKVVLGEVERVVRASPGFAHAVVVGVDDVEWGERAAVAAPTTPAAAASDALAVLSAATDAAGLGPAARPARLVRRGSDAVARFGQARPTGPRRAPPSRRRPGRPIGWRHDIGSRTTMSMWHARNPSA